MTRVVRALLIANGAVFAVQLLFRLVPALTQFAQQHLPGDSLETGFGLSIKYFRPWQFITCMFMHDPEGIFHILFNLLALWMLGKDVERKMRARPFLVLYATSGVFAGLCHLSLAVFTSPAAPVIGASGAVFGVLIAYALLFPDNRIWFIKARYFVIGLVAFESLMLFTRSEGNVAHLAHIGGAGWGFLFFKGRPIWHRMSEKVQYQKRVRRAQKEMRDRRRVDEILDKINREGIGSLTKQEKNFLNRAGQKNKKRGKKP